jgi:hypothetical protein
VGVCGKRSTRTVVRSVPNRRTAEAWLRRPKLSSRSCGSSSATTSAWPSRQRPRTRSLTFGSARRFRTYPAWRPCSATIQPVPSSRWMPTTVRRRLPVRRPRVSIKAWPGSTPIQARTFTGGFRRYRCRRMIRFRRAAFPEVVIRRSRPAKGPSEREMPDPDAVRPSSGAFGYGVAFVEL